MNNNMEKQVNSVKTFDIINSILKKYEFNSDLFWDNYSEPHRFYHNVTHIDNMIQSAMLQYELTDDLLLAIVFHDIVYDPTMDDNEEASAELFYKWIKNNEVAKAILETKTHNPTTELSRQLCKLDLEVLNGDLETFMKFEHAIFKEYQFIDFSVYRQKRIEVLKTLPVKQEHIEYAKYWQPKIAVYAGTFNPFHVGHHNVLKQAEQLFDKVIIVQGINTSKAEVSQAPIPQSLLHYQIERCHGLLTDFIKGLKYPVTLVVGLRNEDDLKAKKIQQRYMEDLYPEIKIVYIVSDRKYEHISSSGIRELLHFNKTRLPLNENFYK